jgi:peptidoglycan hydrolase-like protein with peptidoglycan-binding domain
LNIITCEGVWNQVSGNYPLRLVVFTDQIPSEGIAPASVVTTAAPAIVVPAVMPVGITFNRPLSTGSKGADVVVLQTFLEQRGLLELPAGVVNGFFGALTRVAVAKYQTSVGLPAVGAFGPLTAARVISDLGINHPAPPVVSNSVLPNAGNDLVPSTPVSAENVATTSNSPIKSSSYFQILIQSAKNLCATPIDGLITLFLLISIIFAAFKIIG